jgi:hypothetical protein
MNLPNSVNILHKVIVHVPVDNCSNTGNILLFVPFGRSSLHRKLQKHHHSLEQMIAISATYSRLVVWILPTNHLPGIIMVRPKNRLRASEQENETCQRFDKR